MPALASVTTDFLSALKDALKQGSDLGSNVRGAAQNYLRAQDTATVLELLQDALTTGTLTATGGSTTTVEDGTGTFVAGQQVGNVVVFDGNTTTALAGVERVITANTDSELTFDEVSDAPVSGDTYTIKGSFVSSAIESLRQGKGLADAPPGSVYGDPLVALDALYKLVVSLDMVSATGTLTLTANAGDTETVTIDGKTYTFQTALTDVDGNVLIGATASDSLDNLIAAINLAAGAGSTYAASTTVHPSVSAAAGAGDTMDVTAKVAVGAAGNDIATTETLANGSWGAATLEGGAQGALTAGLTLSEMTSRARFAGHAGSQPGQNAQLAELIDQAQTAVTNYTLPT